MNLHPATVHFPIALLLASFIFEIIGVMAQDESFRKSALYTLLLALIGTAAAFWTGLMAEGEALMIPTLKGPLGDHKQAAIFTMVLVGLLLFVRILVDSRPSFRKTGVIVYLLLALISIINVFHTGYLGAELVYRHGAAVEPVMRKYERLHNP